MSEAPLPLTPPDCDLRDFPFMPLEINRLRRSKSWLKAKRNPALAFYQINLWTAAWHDVPAGSLEDDDDVLADLAMCDPAKWAKVRDEVMRGWVKCSDGRLYNPTVCEKAMESWAAKVERREKDEHERDRKRREREDRTRMFEQLKAAGQSLPWNTSTTELRRLVTDLSRGQVRDSHGDMCGQSRLREREGQGEGQGQGEREVKSYSGGVGGSTGVGPVDNSDSPPPLSADAIGEQLVLLEAERGRTLRLSSRAHEALLRLEARQVALPVLLRAHALACARRAADGDPSAVNPGFLEPFIDEALALGQGSGTAADWDETTEGVQAKACELGIPPQQDGEAWFWFRLRVIRDSGEQHRIEREVSKAERMNPNEFERVYRLMYGVAPGQVAA
ncbi:DUF1376 domain-containing protein [Cupriavidus alkaliphilus]|uniref:DUF1376 domain-containing protein n=1 Tax=Cupriavidus alkaliphilus TaxID=942866 RepID=UPI0008157008|nr:DUF1376 domain-containing protein [Cupriavidus alkaliphilus]SCB10197.1 Protein of unknown function [Cupriavidus alkaliphilus]